MEVMKRQNVFGVKRERGGKKSPFLPWDLSINKIIRSPTVRFFFIFVKLPLAKRSSTTFTVTEDVW